MSRHRLWIMHGPNWSLPIRATFFDAVVRVQPTDLPLPDNMRKALTDQIEALGIYYDTHQYWVVETLERMADPAGNLTPEECVSWTRPVGRRVVIEQPTGMEGFFEEFAATGLVKTAGSAQVLYGAFCRLMLSWLINKKRPVDLGFAVMEPFPARPNWRDLWVRKMRDHRLFGGSYADTVRRAKNTWPGDDRLLMYNPAHRNLLWSITIRHQRSWWKAVIQSERDRRKRRPSFHGLVDARDYMKQRAKAMYACFVDYLSQIKYPYPVLPKGGVACGGGKTKQLARGIKVRPTGGNLDNPAALGRNGEEVQPQKLAKSYARVSKVSDLYSWLPRKPAYVRRGRPDLAKPVDGAE